MPDELDDIVDYNWKDTPHENIDAAYQGLSALSIVDGEDSKVDSKKIGETQALAVAVIDYSLKLILADLKKKT
jgi:hypothetical protein